jgi:hypothetical protein
VCLLIRKASLVFLSRVGRVGLKEGCKYSIVLIIGRFTIRRPQETEFGNQRVGSTNS